jgi:hypothetical protein
MRRTFARLNERLGSNLLLFRPRLVPTCRRTLLVGVYQCQAMPVSIQGAR